MNEGWKKWLIKSAGFGAGFALITAAVLGTGLWYAGRPKPVKPWTTTAIKAEFLEPAPSGEKGTVNLWFMLTNTTSADYKIAHLSEITTAGWTRKDDALYGFNEGISFDLPLIVPAHRKVQAILHIELPNLAFGDHASDAQASPTALKAFLSLEEDQQREVLGKLSPGAKHALLLGLRAMAQAREHVTTNTNSAETYVVDFLRSEYADLKGFAVLDERTRYEIDFPLDKMTHPPAPAKP